MIKKIIKILLIIFLILISAIIYLSIFGVKTEKFNNQITKNILKINKKINLGMGDVSYLLNPYNFTIKVRTKNPEILFEGRNLEIEYIETNVSVKSLINNQFSIDDLQITTKKIKLNDIIAFIRALQSSPQLFVLDTITKDGFVIASIKLNFDKRGNIKKNYKITGSIQKAKFNYLDYFKIQNFNLDFEIDKNSYSLTKIKARFNNIKVSSPQIEIKKKENSFFVNGQISNDKKIFDINELKSIFTNLFKDIDIKKIEFSSTNNFSFSISKALKFDNLKVETIINLNQLIFSQKNLRLKQYIPNFVDEVKLEKHKIAINYEKNIFYIKGNGSISLGDKSENLSYQIDKENNNFLFDTKINLKNSSLLIDFLNYEKKENIDSLISINGSFKKNNKLRFDFITLKENNNEISIKGLNLNKNLRILGIESFNINYLNDKKILNKLKLKKDNSTFTIEGESFDASKLINTIMDGDDEDSPILYDLDSNIIIKIKKVYINEVDYLNNLHGNINFDNNKINELKLESIFSNNKKINLSINTNNNSETVTKLYTDYPKPLIKRYDFIKGFEEGYLDFYSTKKGDLSNSVLIIDNFKVKEVPIFAKLLSLASLQGVADLLTGEGIRFTDFEMKFSNQKNLTTIHEIYAIGPAVSILMDGYIESKKLVSLRGTLVPATTINRSIASIPLLGKILIGDKIGEGIFGVSFKIKGPPKNLKTTVNPIKSLTPRFITRTLDKIKKN